MQKTEFLKDYLGFAESLAGTADTSTKLTRIADWLKSLPGIKDARIINLLSQYDGSILQKELPESPEYTETLADILRLKDAVEWQKGRTLLCPVKSDSGEALGALLLKGEDQFLRELEVELNLLNQKLREILEKDLLSEKITRLEGFINLLAEPEREKAAGLSASPLHLLMDGLNLPLYITDFKGRFIHINRDFLGLVKYRDLIELNNSGEFFMEPKHRDEELEIIRQKGRINNFRLSIKTGDGKQLSINDSALLRDSFIFGVFFDVTELMILNKEIQEALEVQEFLNDRIIESAKILQKTQLTAIKSLARLAEYRDAETGDHLQRIGEYTRLLAARVHKESPYGYDLSGDYVNDIAISSMLHDIGKVGVPDSILLKPGKLNAKEWDIMKNHTNWGWAILNKADRELGEQSFLTLASTVALHHHERYDGTGYPHGLKGEDIPLSARIMAIADVYDALTTRRPYKEPWPHEEAVKEIYHQKGKQFCPALIELFPSVEEEFVKIKEKFPR